LHEYSLMEQVIAHILAELKKAEGAPQGAALEVVLNVGALAVHSEAATRQAYEVLVKGTPLENSRLRLTIEPVTLVCAKCGREFGDKDRHLLTVHHRDGNHMNNPPDGSNWENLCIYCHDDEHSRTVLGDYLNKEED